MDLEYRFFRVVFLSYFIIINSFSRGFYFSGSFCFCGNSFIFEVFVWVKVYYGLGERCWFGRFFFFMFILESGSRLGSLRFYNDGDLFIDE